MGSPLCQTGRGRNNEPERQVTLTHEFEIGETEVTQGQWLAVGLSNPSRPPTSEKTYGDCMAPSCPVGFATWFEAAAFSNALSAHHGLESCYVLEGCTGSVGVDLRCTGGHTTHTNQYECAGYRLPTDAEWEYAARAGTRTPYYTGEMEHVDVVFQCSPMPALASAAWFCDTASNMTTRPVRQKLPNGWGLYDVLGNVAEWTSNLPYNSGYAPGPLTDPGEELIFDVDNERPTRGGRVVSAPAFATASNRLTALGNERFAGVRVVRTLGLGRDGGR